MHYIILRLFEMLARGVNRNRGRAVRSAARNSVERKCVFVVARFVQAQGRNAATCPLAQLPSVGGVLCTERIPYQRERLTHRDRRLTRDKRTGDGASAFLSLESRNLSKYVHELCLHIRNRYRGCGKWHQCEYCSRGECDSSVLHISTLLIQRRRNV